MVFVVLLLAAGQLAAQLISERPVIGEMRPVESVTGEWTQAGGRNEWRAMLQSAGAGAVRAHIRNFHVGSGTLTVSGLQGEAAAVSTADGIYGDGDFWTGIVPGDTLLLRFHAEDNSRTDPEFVIAGLTHFYAKVNKPDRERETVLNCYRDPFGTTWQAATGPVALMVYTDTVVGAAFTCTGTLIADKNRTGRALFLTASHCIPREEDARTLVTYWNFQTTAGNTYPYQLQNENGVWNGTIPTVPTVNGAHLLYVVGKSEGDMSLLELTSLPVNAEFANLNTQELALGAPTGTIQHPDGSWKRLSTGARAPITSGLEAGINLNGIYRPSDYYYKITETNGITGYGSSGSSVLTTGFLVSGVLSSGPAPSCSLANPYTTYGRLSTLFARLQPILNNSAPNSCPVDFNTLNLQIGSGPASGSFQITAPANCYWAVAADNDFITVNQRVGTGSTTIAWQAAANMAQNGVTDGRVGSISVIGDQRRVLHIQQSGTSTSTPYADIGTDPFREFIRFINTQNVFSAYGCTAGNFCPSATTTRGMMAQFVIQSLLGDSFPVQLTPYFDDVPTTHPAYYQIQKMKELGITAGCSLTSYCPDQPVTRGQMAVFIVRALQVRNGLAAGTSFAYSAQQYFSDVPTNHSFFTFIQRMKELGITSGCDTTKFCPDDANTRGQIAVFLTRGLYALWQGRPR